VGAKESIAGYQAAAASAEAGVRASAALTAETVIELPQVCASDSFLA
jgi:hypothetical protein